MICRRLIIRGRVQGVFYRASTREEATRLGLEGWVRNLPDGGVEARVMGEEADVERFIEWCRRGPPHSRVDSVEILEEALPADREREDGGSGDGGGFGVRY